MYDNNNIKSLINPDSDEEIVKVYNARHSTNVDLKKLLISSLLTVTVIAFAIFFYIIVFCGDIKKGAFAYDSVSYWTNVSVLILAYVFVVIDCLLACFIYYGLKNAAAKNASDGIIFILTTRRIATINTKTNELVSVVLLSNVSDVSRYTDDQLKVITYSGEDLVIKPDDTQDFIDTYPGLLRSERQRARRLANEG